MAVIDYESPIIYLINRSQLFEVDDAALADILNTNPGLDSCRQRVKSAKQHHTHTVQPHYPVRVGHRGQPGRPGPAGATSLGSSPITGTTASVSLTRS